MIRPDSTNSASFLASGTLATLNLFLGHCYMVLQIISLLLAIVSFTIGIKNEIKNKKKESKK